MDGSRAAPLHERLERLAEFLPIFEAPGFQFGEWGDITTSEPGVLQMPFYSLSDAGSSFCQTAYDFGWVLADFNWPVWNSTPEAERLRDDHGALANATPDQLAMLLTVILRQDRFCEGELASCFASGLLTRIVRRAGVLRSELP